MRKIVVTEWMTLDGVVQSPAYPDEDPSGGFRHGGWHPRFFDELSMKWVMGNVTGAGGFLLGRRRYETFAAHWPNASREEQALAEPLNRLPKYVASRTLAAPLAWQNSTCLEGDVATAVAALQHEAGRDLLAIGSTELVRTLVEADLVDEFRFMIDPIVVGGGKRIFRDDGALRSYRLVESQVTTTGAMLVTYARQAGVLRAT